MGDNLVSLHSGEVLHVTKRKDNGDFEGHPLRLDRLRPTSDLPNLPWHLVGVHRNLGVNAKKVCTFSRRDVRGKMMCCGDIISEWLPEWLMSKKD